MKKIFEIVKKIPCGKVITYNELAKKLKTSPRAVGRMLNRNEHPIIIPCHRVVMSDGRIGGYKLGTEKKKELLMKEGVIIKNNKVSKEYFFYL